LQNELKEFCDEKNGDYILLISNEFILQTLPCYFN